MYKKVRLNSQQQQQQQSQQQQQELEEADEEAMFLPSVRDQYKYLGLMQLQEDVPLNFQIAEEKSVLVTEKIMSSALSPSQKVQL